MRSLLVSLGVAALIFTSCGEHKHRQSFMPENDLWKQDGYTATSMDQATFNSVIDQVDRVYRPIIAGLGGRLVFKRFWSDSTVNAYADRDNGNWNVSMYGGLARRPEITRLGFLMVVCHEVTHHIGGYPNYTGEWASDEGNSDYVGVHACMKRVLANVTENVKYLEPYAVEKCKRYFTGQKRRVCYTIMSAAKSCADLLGVLGGSGKPRFEAQSTLVVSQTAHEHPEAQCRLDTMSNAAVCEAPWDDQVIPNAFNYQQYSCTVGNEDYRPRCWFAG